MEKKFELNPPIMPNFITYNSAPVRRQDGFRNAPSIPVDELSEDEANEYAELMKQTFLKHWANRVKVRKNGR